MAVSETVPKPIACRTGGVLGYARVSTADQDAAGQRDRLDARSRNCWRRLIRRRRRRYASSPAEACTAQRKELNDVLIQNWIPTIRLPRRCESAAQRPFLRNSPLLVTCKRNKGERT